MVSGKKCVGEPKTLFQGFFTYLCSPFINCVQCRGECSIPSVRMRMCNKDQAHHQYRRSTSSVQMRVWSGMCSTGLSYHQYRGGTSSVPTRAFSTDDTHLNYGCGCAVRIRVISLVWRRVCSTVLLLAEWEVSAGIYCPQPFPYWPTEGRSMRKRLRAIYSCTDRPTGGQCGKGKGQYIPALTDQLS